MKKFGSTYLFAGIVILVACYTYFFEFKSAEKDEDPFSKSINLLSDVKESDVVEFKITKGKEEKSFIKKEGIWMMTAPLEDHGDRFTIENSIRNLLSDNETELKNEDGTSPDAKTFGLDDPAGTIELKTSQKSFKFLIGKEKSFDGQGYHLKLDGSNQIYLATNRFGEVLDKPVKELRSKDIFPDNIQPTMMTLEVFGKKPLRFEKQGEVWTYPADKELKLDNQAIGELASGLKFIKAREFLSETSTPQDLKKFELQTPEVKLTVSFLDKTGDALKTKDVSVSVSKVTDGKVSLISSEKKFIYETVSAGTGILNKELVDFRDRKFPFTFDEKIIKQVYVERKNFRISLKHAANKWEIGPEVKLEPLNRELDTNKAQELVSKIRELSADRFVAGSGPKGLSSPESQIVLKDSNGQLVFDMIWGEKFKEGQDDYYFVRTNLSKEVLAIKANRIDELPGESLLKPEKKL